MATEQIASPFEGLQGIFDKIIGTRTRTEGSEQLTLENLINSLKNETVNETGTTSTNQTANTLSQLLSSLTGNTTSNTSNTQTTNADVGALRDVYARQSAGVTPEMLAAIFSEGAKAAPQLVSTTANAMGARPGSNSPLALAMTQLNKELVGQAAQLNTKLLSDAGSTAGQIAQLTKSVTDTGTQNQQQTQNKTDSTTGSTNTNTTQQLQKMIEQITNSQQTQTQDQHKLEESTTLGGINQKQSAIAGGLAGLVSLLGQAGGAGGIGGNLQGLVGQIGKLFGIGGGTPLDPTGDPIYTPGDPSYSDAGSGNYDGIIPTDNWWDDPGYEWDFADGGLVEPERLKMNSEEDKKEKKQDPMLALLALLAQQGAEGSFNFGSGESTADTGTTAPAEGDPHYPQNATGAESTIHQNMFRDAPNVDWKTEAEQYAEIAEIDARANAERGATTPWVAIGLDTALTPKNIALVREMGYKGDIHSQEINPYWNGKTGDGGDGNEATMTVISPDFKKWMSDNDLHTKSYMPEAGQNVTGFFNSKGQMYGPGLAVTPENDEIFGAVMALAGGAMGGFAGGAIASSAGATAGSLASSAATGAGAGFGSAAAQSADIGTALKGAATGAVTGGLGSFNPAGMLGITDPRISSLLNSYLKGQAGGAIKEAIGGKKKGHADGGYIPSEKKDPEGNDDLLNINVSGGEYVVPKDVVDFLGAEFFDSLKLFHHRPATST